LAPSQVDITPVALVRMSGEVSGATGLVGGRGTPSTMLTMRPGIPAPVVVLDYGEDVGGVPSLEVRAERGAPTLRVAYSEGLSYLGPTGDGGASLSATAAQSRFDDFHVDRPRVLTSGEVQGGERYQLLTLTTPGSVTLRRVSIHFTAFRAGPDAYRGWFLSSSPLLNRIWYAGAYTTQLDQLPPESPVPSWQASNSMAVMVDGAKRDRKIWAADLTVEGPNIMYSTGTNAYFRDSLALLASYQASSGEEAGRVEPNAPLGTFPASGDVDNGAIYSASYSMDVILGIASYYRFSGDLGFVRSQWQNIMRELAWNRSLVDGRSLLVTGGEGLDWDYYDGAKTGAVTAYNAIYVETLRDAADLADALGRHGDAAAYRTQAQQVAEAINRYLWDSGEGAYVVSDTKPGTVAEDGDALAILYGIASPSDVPAILTAMRQTLWTTPYGPLPYSTNSGYQDDISPFAANLEVQARFAVGDTAGALTLMSQLWGQMLASGPNATSTFWEVLHADGTPALGGFTSLAHGWASGPTPDLSAYVLGIEPRSAGFGTWTVAPHPGPLRWAEGQAPTPRGPIHVRWNSEANGALSLSISAPAGTEGVAQVPLPSKTANVTLNGRRIGADFVTAPNGAVSAFITVRGGAQIHITVSPSG
jgi:alpha-L-rhamnosidase